MRNKNKIPLEQAWQNWTNCLNGEDINSIFRQITTNIWDTAIFRIILESRNNQIRKNPRSPEINWALQSFIDRNYFQAQSAFIRRLTDQSYGLTGDKGIYSIGAMIKNIQSYRLELTREKYFKLRNMPYDYLEVRKRMVDFLGKQDLEEGFSVPSEFNWESIAEAHQTFNRLCHVTEQTRKADDLIVESVFTRLFNKLDTCKNIKNYVDKFIAHSATPESRSSLEMDKVKITFRQLWDAHKIIIEVADFLSFILFSVGHYVLAIENPGFYQFWEKPICENGEIDTIRTTLDSYRKETEKWILEGTDSIWRWIEA